MANGNKDWGNTFQQYSNDNNLMIAAAATGVLPCLLSVLLTGDMFALFAGAAGVVIGLFALIAAKGAKGVPLRRRDESIQRARPLQRRLPRLRDRYLQEQPLGLHPEQGERAITNRSTILARCGVGGAGEKGLPEPDDRSKEAPPLAKPADRQAPKEKAAIVVSAVRLSAKGCSPMMQLTRRVFNSGN